MTATDVVEVVVVGRASLDGLTCSMGGVAEGGATSEPVGAPTRDGLVFRFTQVPAGAWNVVLGSPERATRSWVLQVPDSENGNRRQVVVFGTATLYGTLYDLDGRPLAGRVVRVNLHDLETQDEIQTRTDATGAYRVDGLREGSVSVDGSLGVPEARGGIARHDTADLEAGASVRLDLGQPTPHLRFSLRLTRASGSVPRVTPYGAGHDVFFDEATDAGRSAGRFTGRAPLGEFRIGVEGENLRQHGWIGSIDVTGDGQEFTLTVPGVAVEGQVVDGVEDLGVPALPRGDCQVLLIGIGPDRWGGIGVAPDADGRFQFEAVPAGRYTVLVRDRRDPEDPQAPREAWVRIDVPADRDVTGLELRRPPR